MTTRLTLVATARQLRAPRTFPDDGPVDDAFAARARSLARRLPAGLTGWCGADRTSRDTGHALGLDLTPVEALGAWQYGAWAGRELDEFDDADDRDALARFVGDVAARPPDGEAFTDVYERVARWFAAQPFDAQHYALVATAPVVRALLGAAIGGGARAATHLDVGPLTRARLQRHGGRWRLRALGRA